MTIHHHSIELGGITKMETLQFSFKISQYHSKYHNIVVIMKFIIIIIHFYQFGTGRHSQKAVKPVRCDYLKPWGDLLESSRVGQLINFKSKKKKKNKSSIIVYT